MTAIEFTDRYDALGIKPPPLILVCRADCDGVGVVPVFVDSEERRADRRRQGRTIWAPPEECDPRMIALWDEAEREAQTDDGWHFVRCPDCAGTGRQPGPTWWIVAKNLPEALRQKARFARFHLFSRQTWRMDVPHPVWFNVRLALRILLTNW